MLIELKATRYVTCYIQHGEATPTAVLPLGFRVSNSEEIVHCSGGSYRLNEESIASVDFRHHRQVLLVSISFPLAMLITLVWR